MCPLFATSVTYMDAMFPIHKVIFIQMGAMTVVVCDILHNTSLIQRSYSSINTLIQCELRCNTLKILSTKRSILIGQEELLMLGPTQQCVCICVPYT